jgi:hypothetical protein
MLYAIIGIIRPGNKSATAVTDIHRFIVHRIGRPNGSIENNGPGNPGF